MLKWKFIAGSYTDWYEPGETWSQSLLHPDTVTGDLLQLDQPQPIADVGSLCTVMIPLITTSTRVKFVYTVVTRT